MGGGGVTTPRQKFCQLITKFAISVDKFFLTSCILWAQEEKFTDFVIFEDIGGYCKSLSNLEQEYAMNPSTLQAYHNELVCFGFIIALIKPISQAVFIDLSALSWKLMQILINR